MISGFMSSILSLLLPFVTLLLLLWKCEEKLTKILVLIQKCYYLVYICCLYHRVVDHCFVCVMMHCVAQYNWSTSLTLSHLIIPSISYDCNIYQECTQVIKMVTSRCCNITFLSLCQIAERSVLIYGKEGAKSNKSFK